MEQQTDEQKRPELSIELNLFNNFEIQGVYQNLDFFTNSHSSSDITKTLKKAKETNITQNKVTGDNSFLPNTQKESHMNFVDSLMDKAGALMDDSSNEESKELFNFNSKNFGQDDTDGLGLFQESILAGDEEDDEAIFMDESKKLKSDSLLPLQNSNNQLYMDQDNALEIPDDKDAHDDPGDMIFKLESPIY